MPLHPRKIIAGLNACAHGGFNYAELNALGLDAGDILDFSVSTNPFMPPPDIRETVISARFDRYPDSQSTLLRRMLSNKLGVDTDNIVIGSGTTELIRLIALAYFRRGDPVVIAEPTYGEYEIASRLSGARPVKFRAAEADDFVPCIRELVEIVRHKQPRGVFICNPNNPTGKYLPQRDIIKVLQEVNDGLLILDEAYVPFIKNSWNSLDLIKKGNVIVLRSMTKDYSIPGLRLGYAVACREIIDVLRSVIPPWNVNTIAQQVGLKVLENIEYLVESLRKTREAKDYLTTELTRLGFNVLPSDTHYFLVKVGSATQCRRSLLSGGIMVRDCSSFGLPRHIRISPRTLPDCRKLVASFRDILNPGGIYISEKEAKPI